MYRLELDFSGKKKHLVFFDDMIMNFLKMSEFKEYKRFHFVLHEAIINSMKAIEINDDKQRRENIKIEIEVNDKEVNAIVTDWMTGIEDSKENVINTLKDKDNAFMESGRGLLMMEHMVDSFTWGKGENGEFCVYMTVKRQ